MPAALIALLVFVLVALAAFALFSLLDQRSARARLIKERLANERKAPERAPEEELALLRDEQLSQIPALDNLLRRSARVTDIQKMLAPGGYDGARRQFSRDLGGCRRRGHVRGLWSEQARRSRMGGFAGRLCAPLFLRFVSPQQAL